MRMNKQRQATMWMNMTNKMLSDRNPTQEYSCMIQYISRSKASKIIYPVRRQGAGTLGGGSDPKW